MGFVEGWRTWEKFLVGKNEVKKRRKLVAGKEKGVAEEKMGQVEAGG